MKRFRIGGWFSVVTAGAILIQALLSYSARGQEAPTKRGTLKEPVYRVARNNTSNNASDAVQIRATPHPLDPAMKMARSAMVLIEQDIRDYTCTLVKRERINGELLEPEYMFTKIRNRQVEGGQITVPFSVYMRFLGPTTLKDREVIYIENTNNGKMIAHEGGLKGRFLPSVWLKPDSMLAMKGNRYPITEVGILTLTKRLIEKGERDRKYDECEVKFYKGVKLGPDKRKCTCLQVMHPKPRPHFDFHIARIYIDDEHQIPIRYEAFGWPNESGGNPELLEEYTYLDMKLNVGLTDKDFDHRNTEYNF